MDSGRISTLNSAGCFTSVQDPQPQECDKNAKVGLSLERKVTCVRDEARSTNSEEAKHEPRGEGFSSEYGRSGLPIVHNQRSGGMLTSDLSPFLGDIRGSRHGFASIIAPSLIPIAPVLMMTIPQPLSLSVMVQAIPRGLILHGEVSIFNFMS